MYERGLSKTCFIPDQASKKERQKCHVTAERQLKVKLKLDTESTGFCLIMTMWGSVVVVVTVDKCGMCGGAVASVQSLCAVVA